MVQVQRTSLWLAAFFACLGTACIAVYLLTRKPDGYLLFGAAIAAVFSAASLLVGVIFVCIESVSWIRPAGTGSRIVLPRPGPVADSASASALSEQFQERREVLSERLNIDEPHFCSHVQAPCTSWSFCGSAPDKHPVTFVADQEGPEGQGAGSPQEAAGREQPMPVIQRSGVPVSCLALAPAADTCGKPRCASDRLAKSA